MIKVKYLSIETWSCKWKKVCTISMLIQNISTLMAIFDRKDSNVIHSAPLGVQALISLWQLDQQCHTFCSPRGAKNSWQGYLHLIGWALISLWQLDHQCHTFCSPRGANNSWQGYLHLIGWALISLWQLDQQCHTFCSPRGANNSWQGYLHLIGWALISLWQLDQQCHTFCSLRKKQPHYEKAATFHWLSTALLFDTTRRLFVHTPCWRERS